MSNRSIVDQAQLGRRRGGGGGGGRQVVANWFCPAAQGHARYNKGTHTLQSRDLFASCQNTNMHKTGTHTLRYTLAPTRQFKSLNLCVFVCVFSKLLVMCFHLDPNSQYGLRVMCKFCPSPSTADYRVT